MKKAFVAQQTNIFIKVFYFSVDKLHPWLAGPLGGAEKQHAELLQVPG